MRIALGCCLGVVLFAGCEMPEETKVTDTDLGPATSFEPDPESPPYYEVTLETTKGPVVIAVERDLSPRGADRFYLLVNKGFYDNAKFFRVLDFMAQVGMAADPKVNSQWENENIPDDPVKISNVEGTVSFANRGPGTRSAQIFINKQDNTQSLDPQGFSPFGRVISGMENVHAITDEYGEQPNQGRIGAEGNEYLDRQFPNLDAIKTAKVTKEGAPAEKADAAGTPAEEQPEAADATESDDSTEASTPAEEAAPVEDAAP